MVDVSLGLLSAGGLGDRVCAGRINGIPEMVIGYRWLDRY